MCNVRRQLLAGRGSILNLTIIRTNGAFATRSSQITFRTCLNIRPLFLTASLEAQPTVQWPKRHKRPTKITQPISRKPTEIQ